MLVYSVGVAYYCIVVINRVYLAVPLAALVHSVGRTRVKTTRKIARKTNDIHNYSPTVITMISTSK